MSITKYFDCRMTVDTKTLWDKIKSELDEIEQYEAKSIIGFDLIDQIEEISLEVFRHWFSIVFFRLNHFPS